MRWNESVTAEQQKLIAEACGAGGESAADAIAGLIASLEQPTTLRDAGVDRAERHRC